MGGTTPGLSSVEVQRESETYAQLVTTDEMKTRAKAELGSEVPDDVTIEAEYVPDTSVLRISAVSDDPAEARDVANAYAAALTKWRRQVAIDQYKEAEKIILQKIDDYGDDPARLSDPGYVQLVGRLQDIRLLEASATGNFVVASAGVLPDAPFAPQHIRDVVIGFLIGVIAGIGLVTLAEQLDVRIHSVDDLAATLNLPVLARFPRLSRGQDGVGGLTAMNEPAGPMAEASRMLRGNLDFVNVDGEVTSLIVTSCSQGEGKTTTAANLGVALARAGKRVIIVDSDLRRPRLHRFFDLPNRIGLSTVVAGRTSLAEALQPFELGPRDRATGADLTDWTEGVEARSRLYVLPSGPLPPNPGEIAASRRLAEVIAELSGICDLVLLDAPPLLVVGDTAALARAAGGMLVVARLGIVTKAMLTEAVEALAQMPCRKLGVVVTGIPVEGTAYRYRYFEESSASEPETSPNPDDPVAA